MTPVCASLTAKGTPCKNDAQPGSALCAIHTRMSQEQIEEALQRMTDEAIARNRAQVGGPVDTVPTMPLRILASDDQPPLVAVVCALADELVVTGPIADDFLGRRLADDLASAGGSHDDMEFLIEAGCAPDWTRGYFRALTPIGGAQTA